jgi:histidine ammonia-lyase
MVDMLNKGVTPMVLEKGSVGVSGDLSPMSFIAEVVMGEGEAYYKGKLMSGKKAMKKAKIKPVTLSYKEGLGVINGPQVMAGGGALLQYDGEGFIKKAMIAAAMTIDALRSVKGAYAKLLHEARGHKGQIVVAKNLRKMFQGSEIMAWKSGKVQDGYSLRCTPQVMGPALDLLKYTREQITREINAVSDNPVFFPDQRTYLAGGNFHGQNVGLAMDYMAIALSDVGNLSERHTNRLLNPVLSGLPDFLVEGRGLNSGLMVAQYTAAALASENKVLSHPAQVDSFSVSADQEDHVSMGPIAVRKMTEILKNLHAIVAIEMLCAAQAFDFHKPRKPGKGTIEAYKLIRKKVSFMKIDRSLYPDIKAVDDLMWSDDLVKAVEKKVGKIEIL